MNRLNPLAELDAARARQIGLLVSDVDETLTIDGKLTGKVLDSFERLVRMGIKIVPATGRSAGFGQTFACYLPHIEGCIAENGGVFCVGEKDVRYLIKGDPARTAEILQDAFEQIRESYPALRPSSDSFGRLTDFSIPRSAVDDDDLPLIAELATKAGVGMVYSSVHLHLYYSKTNKANAVRIVSSELGFSPDQVLVIGDSPNDASMFEPGLFGVSVGVANLAKYRNAMRHLPEFICNNEGGEGFCELVDLLENLRQPT
jgi:hydroxymethylpyrimidine pyrophosphatase-like HAD family hydrolase